MLSPERPLMADLGNNRGLYRRPSDFRLMGKSGTSNFRKRPLNGRRNSPFSLQVGEEMKAGF